PARPGAAVRPGVLPLAGGAVRENGRLAGGLAGTRHPGHPVALRAITRLRGRHDLHELALAVAVVRPAGSPPAILTVRGGPSLLGEAPGTEMAELDTWRPAVPGALAACARSVDTPGTGRPASGVRPAGRHRKGRWPWRTARVVSRRSRW